MEGHRNSKRRIWVVLFGVGVLIVVIVAGLIFFKQFGLYDGPFVEPDIDIVPVFETNTDDWAFYRNDVVGISFFYPPEWGEIISRDRSAFLSQRFMISERPDLAPKFFDFLVGFTLEDLREWNEFINALEARGRDVGKLLRFEENEWIANKERIDGSSAGDDCLPAEKAEENPFGESCEIVSIDGKNAEMWYYKPIQLENIGKKYVFYNRGYRISVAREVTFSRYILTEESEEIIRKLLPELEQRTADKEILRVFDKFDALIDTIEFLD